MEREKTIRAYIDFSEWLIEQPYWLQDAAWNIYNGKDIDNNKINKYVDFCIDQILGEKIDFKSLKQSDFVTEDLPIKISVAKLSDIKNVNDLGEDAKLEFDENGINLIYGLNGSGKSSYMRIFKHVSRTPYKEIIQTNVFKKKSNAKQTCKFEITENEEKRKIEIDLKKSFNDSSLQLMDVFDTRISHKYLTSENNATYQPFVFSALEELAKIADKIKDKINEKIELINPTKIEIPEEYKKHKVSDWLLKLKSGDQIPKNYLKWSEEEEGQLNDIIIELDEEKRKQTLENIEARIKILDPIIKDLEEIEGLFINDNIKTLKKHYFKAKADLKLTEGLFKETTTEIDTISVNSSEWKSMWSSARQYYEEYIFKEN
ncbi:MAG TPA: ATP-binding protein [Mogibacterium sp.]|nr:ATP-binding protein [Mogibacterium sp.]